MHRYPERQSRTIDYGYHQQTPFFRQAIAIIDSSTKLMKDDRIFLRNKIKEYMKQLRQNKQRDSEWQQENIQTLIHIFVEANKKKSLVKIQRGDAVMDWIQIRLRKFIDSHKKEKHKREVETFRNEKYLQIKTSLDIIKSNTNRSRSRQVTSPFEGRSKQNYKNIPATRNNATKYHRNIAPNSHSLSKSNQKFQSIATGQSRAQHSYHKKFDFLRKSKAQDSCQRLQNVKKPLGSERPFKDLWKRTSTLSEYSDKSIQKSTMAVLKKSSLNSSKGSILNYNKTAKQIQPHNQLNHLKQQTKVGPLNQFMQPAKILKERFNSDLIPKYTQPIFENINFSIEQPIRSKPQTQTNQKRIANETVTQPQKLMMSSSVSRYQDSTKKIQKMLQKSNILNQLANKTSIYSMSVNSGQTSTYPNNQIETNTVSQNLFTPPQFLAECRKFMSSSNKKDNLALEQNSVYQKQTQTYHKLTFTDILSESQQRSTEKISKLSHMGINEVISQNGSLIISSQKPGSEVNFQIRDILIYSVEELLLQIFREGPRNLLDRYQLGLIMSRCSSECQRLLQEYCDLLTKQTGSQTEKLKFEFVAMVKYFSTYGKVLQDSKQHFSTFLSTILDIKKKGFVNAEDNQSFLNSLESSQIQSSSLNSICTMLQNIFIKSCEIEGGGCLMTRWSLYYLQLKRDTDLQYLKYLLSKFEFQFDQESD